MPPPATLSPLPPPLHTPHPAKTFPTSNFPTQAACHALACRCGNDQLTELTNAAVEQSKITELRLRKTFGGGADASSQADRRAGQILAHLAPGM